MRLVPPRPRSDGSGSDIQSDHRGQLCTDLEVRIRFPRSHLGVLLTASAGSRAGTVPPTDLRCAYPSARGPRSPVRRSALTSALSGLGDDASNCCSVHAHAAAALINFCEGVERETLIPYLDAIVERLLKLLNPGATDATRQPKRYVQEQVITTLAMVADASEATFAKVSTRDLRNCATLTTRIVSTTRQSCPCS